ncbi:MAG: hypothetical protein ABW056_06735, partial [Thermoanaerobaculia bacterium]
MTRAARGSNGVAAVLVALVALLLAPSGLLAVSSTSAKTSTNTSSRSTTTVAPNVAAPSLLRSALEQAALR